MMFRNFTNYYFYFRSLAFVNSNISLLSARKQTRSPARKNVRPPLRDFKKRVRRDEVRIRKCAVQMSSKWKYRPIDHAVPRANHAVRETGPTHSAAFNARLSKAEWEFRKADRVIHHQSPMQKWHLCAWREGHSVCKWEIRQQGVGVRDVLSGFLRWRGGRGLPSVTCHLLPVSRQNDDDRCAIPR